MRITLAFALTIAAGSFAAHAKLFVFPIADYDGMSGWTGDTGTWFLAGDAMPSPGDPKLLTTKPGETVIVNGSDGRTVNLFSDYEFGYVQHLHIEFMVPEGSNSGVYLMGRYEVQVLDSWGVEKPESSDCGGIYQRYNEKEGYGYEGKPPRVNASKAPGEWQSFDIHFRPPSFDESGKKVSNAMFVEVKHNGVVVHENVEVTGPTRSAAFQDEKPEGPLMLQGDHGPVAYRNIKISTFTSGGG